MTRPDILGGHLITGVFLALATASPSPADDATLPTYRLDLGIELAGHEALGRVRARPDVALLPFTTDACSGGLSQVWSLVARNFPGFAEAHRELPPWENCCAIHDYSYHSAGPDPAPAQSLAARLKADEALHACVVQTGAEREGDLAKHYGMSHEQIRAAYDAIASAMFLAVRLGGGPCTGLPWRWGYGYPPCE